MKCEKCGEKLSEHSNFCRICGTQVKKDVGFNKEVSKNIVSEDNDELTANIDISKISLEKASKNIKKTEKTKKDSKKVDELKAELGDASDDEILLEETKNTKNEKKEKKKSTKKKKTSIEELVQEQTVNNESTIEENTNTTNVDNKQIVASKDITIDSSIDNQKTNIMSIEADSLENTSIIESLDQENFPIRKKGASGLTILLTILLCVTLVGTFYLWTIVKSNNEQIESLNKKIDDMNNSLDEKNGNVEDVSSINPIINGYKVSVEDEYVFINNGIVFSKDDYEIQLYINIDNEYSSSSTTLQKYKNYFINNGYKITNYGTKISKKREYVVYAIVDERNNNYLVAYTALGDNDVISFVVSNSKNTVDYDSLLVLNSLVDNSKREKDVPLGIVKPFIDE